MTPIAGRPLPPGFVWIPAPPPFDGLMMLSGSPLDGGRVDVAGAVAAARDAKAAEVRDRSAATLR